VSSKQPRNVVSVRFSDDELAQVKARADQTGQPVSTLIRTAALTPAANAGIIEQPANRTISRPDITLTGSNGTSVSMHTQGFTLRA